MEVVHVSFECWYEFGGEVSVVTVVVCVRTVVDDVTTTAAATTVQLDGYSMS